MEKIKLYKEKLSDYPNKVSGLEALYYKHDLLANKINLTRHAMDIDDAINNDEQINKDLEKDLSDLSGIDLWIEFMESRDNGKSR